MHRGASIQGGREKENHQGEGQKESEGSRKNKQLDVNIKEQTTKPKIFVVTYYQTLLLKYTYLFSIRNILIKTILNRQRIHRK